MTTFPTFKEKFKKKKNWCSKNLSGNNFVQLNLMVTIKHHRGHFAEKVYR